MSTFSLSLVAPMAGLFGFVCAGKVSEKDVFNEMARLAESKEALVEFIDKNEDRMNDFCMVFYPHNEDTHSLTSSLLVFSASSATSRAMKEVVIFKNKVFTSASVLKDLTDAIPDDNTFKGLSAIKNNVDELDLGLFKDGVNNLDTIVAIDEDVYLFQGLMTKDTWLKVSLVVGPVWGGGIAYSGVHLTEKMYGAMVLIGSELDALRELAINIGTMQNAALAKDSELILSSFKKEEKISDETDKKLSNSKN